MQLIIYIFLNLKYILFSPKRECNTIHRPAMNNNCIHQSQEIKNVDAMMQSTTYESGKSVQNLIVEEFNVDDYKFYFLFVRAY